MLKFIDQLEEWVKNEEFGNGQGSVVAYETAWVARLKSTTQPVCPLFPKALEWLRNNQLTDGSWGTEYPYSIFDRLISTLITIICLKQWNFEEDRDRLEKGLSFMRKELFHLEKLNSMRDKMTVGFEYILPKLISEAYDFGIDLRESEKITALLLKETEKKMNKIDYAIKMNVKGPWLYNLEGLNLHSIKEMKSLINPDTCLINCSYSATAYAIYRGVICESSKECLGHTIDANDGGIPTSYQMKVFDLSWSIAYLIWAGVDVNHSAFGPHLDFLEKLWIKEKGMLSAVGSDVLTPDADDIAMTAYVLSADNRIKGIDSLKSLLSFYREDYFITWEAETNPSFSVNIHAMIAMKNYQDEESLVRIRSETYKWLKKCLEEKCLKIHDKWHSSHYYLISRALIAIEYIDFEMSKTIFEYLFNSQRKDGGWGEGPCSTPIETSMVVIALAYWMRIHHSLDHKKNVQNLMKAKPHLHQNNTGHKFWINKTHYSLVNLDKTIIFAANFTLDNFSPINK